MASDYQERNVEHGLPPADERESSEAFSADSVHNFPSTGSHGQSSRVWSHFRLRVVVLILLGLSLFGWFLHLLMRAEGGDPFDEPLTLWVLALLLVWSFAYGYSTRFSRCPQCGKYTLGEEGNYFINLLKTLFSLSEPATYWEICRNCGYREEHETVSIN